MKILKLPIIFLGVLICFTTCKTAQNASRTLGPRANLVWHSYHDLTTEEYAQKYDELRRDGFILKDMDAYKSGDRTLFSMIWEENTDGRKWSQWRNMTADSYREKSEENNRKGYLLSDIEGYTYKGKQNYAAIWEENLEGIKWQSYTDLTSSEFNRIENEKKGQGYRLVDIEAYETPNGLRYACIWHENVNKTLWILHKDLTRSNYEKMLESFSNKNFRVVEFESYQVDGELRYAVIWVFNKENHASHVRSGRNELAFNNLYRLYRDQGFRLVDFERHETPKGLRYAGVWIENDDRYRWAKKRKIDDLISTYRVSSNLPGISVAIIHKGNLVYQRGFGKADSAAGKDAHGRSVYLLASVSKVIGGTMAVKLESKSPFITNNAVKTLDLSKKTRTYLNQMNARHTHTVEELMAHLGCIWHYTTGPEPPDGHYPTALSAAQQIWGTAPLNNFTNSMNRRVPCVIGDTQLYSTHAFTFLAAVLEQVTGKTTAQLIEDEINKPYGLNSIRVQFEDSVLQPNYDRVVPYNRDTATNYSNSSWKALGGGLEADAVDVAWFGWKVLNGEIVDSATRENRLWSKFNGTGKYGLSWRVATATSERTRNVAQHTGSALGARSILRVYRDAGDQLAIAILTNQRERDTSSIYYHNPSLLATAIADEILDP
jgi:CubicO group peptidase (beta-lactamase class C family)